MSPPAPQKKGMSTGLKVVLIGAGLSVLLCGGGFVACTAFVGKAASDVSKEQEAKVDHVKLKTCEIDSADSDFLPSVKFDLEVINASQNQHTYIIDVFIYDAKNTRVGNTTTLVSDVRPGQKAVEEGSILLSQKVKGKISCKIDKVS
ncbi:hypothetical protein [Micromonospora sp. NPDC047730]|uniref:hypothetical protein n=1 Tax=Micromonospora sp. NPDC047730 TaxID=3364253 RepID=UPI00371A30C1